MALAEAGHRVIAYDRARFGRYRSLGLATTTTRSPTISGPDHADGRAESVLVASRWAAARLRATCPATAGSRSRRLSWCPRYCLYRLKTHDNPAGTDQAAFDKSAQA